jgi:hypothetical protein
MPSDRLYARTTFCVLRHIFTILESNSKVGFVIAVHFLLLALNGGIVVVQKFGNDADTSVRKRSSGLNIYIVVMYCF